MSSLTWKFNSFFMNSPWCGIFDGDMCSCIVISEMAVITGIGQFDSIGDNFVNGQVTPRYMTIGGGSIRASGVIAAGVVGVI